MHIHSAQVLHVPVDLDLNQINNASIQHVHPTHSPCASATELKLIDNVYDVYALPMQSV
jgi:hypothetical protein